MMLVRPVSVWKQPCRVIALLLFVSLLFFSPVGAIAQGRGLVQGTVVDSAGEPLVGATVVPGRSSKGAVVTDMEGHFTLNTSLFSVPCDIHINYVGFQEYKIHLTTKQSRNLGIITLADDNHMLNDVVVMAVEKERRKELFCEQGHRWFDLKRTGRSDAVYSACDWKEWASYKNLFPIYENELINNPNLTQTPGWE